MEQCSPFGWIYYNEEEGMMGEMRQYILQSRMELEATVIAAQEEIMRKEEELMHMKELLIMTIKERDEAQSKVQKLMQLQQQGQFQPHQVESQKQSVGGHQQQKATTPTAVSLSNNTNTTTTTNCFSSSSSECEETSIMSSPQGGSNSPTPQQQQPPPQIALPPQIAATLASNRRPLPEKGKLLKAVMEAGPLLQTLLLAGPLPQWQHPPPQLNSIEIPPVTITNSSSPRKRSGLDYFDCSMISSPKYQRVV